MYDKSYVEIILWDFITAFYLSICILINANYNIIFVSENIYLKMYNFWFHTFYNQHKTIFLKHQVSFYNTNFFNIPSSWCIILIVSFWIKGKHDIVFQTDNIKHILCAR